MTEIHYAIGSFSTNKKHKKKTVAPCTRDFPRALSNLPVTVRNGDWFVALLIAVVIDRGYDFGIGVRQSYKNR